MVDRKQEARPVDDPQPCFVRLRRESKGPLCAARIYQRLGMLVAEINEQPASVEQVWNSGDLTTEAEYRALLTAINSPRPF
jgi:hypothetical protein